MGGRQGTGRGDQGQDMRHCAGTMPGQRA
jgi:hypothetical protein